MGKLRTWVILLTISLFVFLSIFAFNVRATVDPLAFPNNRFGIHILSDSDLENAARLVNSSGGDWGYVTLVIREDERVNDKWQETFNRMRRLHLIPIVRLATRQEDDVWTKPEKENVRDWVDFLNSLNWVVKNRYVIIGNEVNHAREWGGNIDPEEYSDYFVELARELKESNEDYFLLNAGLDASAPSDNNHMGEVEFLTRMVEKNEDIFDYIDGWNSHSYPNPNFQGSPDDVGRGTIRTFEWELEMLESLGVVKDLPVFITETGWASFEINETESKKEEELIAENITKAFEAVWNDKRVVAVTPFILNYQEAPFDVFSWITKEGEFRSFYQKVVEIDKTPGAPLQETSGEIITTFIPPILKISGSRFGIAYARNTGQSIWYKDKTSIFKEKETVFEVVTPIFSDIEPGEKGFIYFNSYETSDGEYFAAKL